MLHIRWITLQFLHPSRLGILGLGQGNAPDIGGCGNIPFTLLGLLLLLYFFRVLLFLYTSFDCLV